MGENDADPLDRILYAFSWSRIGVDLRLAVLWLGLALLGIYLPVLNASPLRVVLALPVVLFIPGYSLIAALFPGSKDIDGIERLALSFGLSIAVVPLIGLVLNYAPWGIRLDPIVASLTMFTVMMLVMAQYRRALLPPEERYHVPFREAWRSFRAEFFGGGTRLDRVLSVLLLIAIVAAVTATVYVIIVPKEGERFTEFYILGATGKAADYPADLFVGRDEKLIIGIGNHEYRNVSYTVELWLMNTTYNPGTNTTDIDRTELLDRFSVELPHNATWQQPRTFALRGTGYNELQLLLFAGPAPPDSVAGLDRVTASYRDLHLWVTVHTAG
jgi:uncharacterized membrane protein